jgi:hypothetical protein
MDLKTQIKIPQTQALNIPVFSSSNCEQCAFFRYEASWGHGWCYNDNSQYSGKLRGDGKSCKLDTSKR